MIKSKLFSMRNILNFMNEDTLPQDNPTYVPGIIDVLFSD